MTPHTFRHLTQSLALSALPLAALALSACADAVSPVVESQGPAPHAREVSSDPQLDALRRLQGSSRTPAVVRMDQGFPRLVNVTIPGDSSDPMARAQGFLNAYADLYQLRRDGLALSAQRVVGLDGQSVIFSQTLHGLPVYGASLLVLTDGAQIRGTVGQLLLDTGKLSLVPAIGLAQALELARGLPEVEKASLRSEAQLVLYDGRMFGDEKASPRLAYRMVFGGGALSEVLLDAEKGSLLLINSLEMSADYSDFDLDLRDALGNNAKNTNCYSSVDTTEAGDEDGVNSDFSSDKDMTDLYKFSKQTWGFYQDTFGITSYDDDEAELDVYVHSSTTGGASYSSGCDLFQWTDPFVGLDVFAHEFTHAVINQTSQLTYAAESGALNESYADVIAALADGNWTMGESTDNGTLRDLSDPTAQGQPDKMSTYVPASAPYTQSNDYGWVHTNSGIPNKAHYLIAAGGSFNGWTVSGIGKTKMGLLAYATMVSLPSSATIADAGEVESTLASMLVGMPAFGITAQNACQVRNAWASIEAITGDRDCDGILDRTDKDDDGDGVLDTFDNCSTVANPGQQNNDLDLQGNACDPDDDNDGVADTKDNCSLPNPNQKDSNHNGLGDKCEDYDDDGILDVNDNCEGDYNPDQKDSNGNGEGDACDPDLDGDTVFGQSDNCPFTENPDQKDTDGDGLGDVCDPCPNSFDVVIGWTTGNPELGMDPRPMLKDLDGDGTPGSCDPTPLGDKKFYEVDGLTFSETGILQDAASHKIEVGGARGLEVAVPLTLCQTRECPALLDPTQRIELRISGLPKMVQALVMDDAGRALARARLEKESGEFRLQFQPRGDRRYFLAFELGSDEAAERPFPISVTAQAISTRK